MHAHLQHLGNNSIPCPLHAKDVGQLFEIDCGSFSNAKDCVTQPRHAQVAQLFVKEVDTQLIGQEWNVLNNGLSYSPLLVFREFDYGR